MNSLRAVAADFVAEVEAALSSAGRADLAPQLSTGTIERCTYDASVDAGYIYLRRPPLSAHFEKLAAPVAETVPFLECGFNVDIDHDGRLFGIEFLSRADVLDSLKHANAL